METKHIAYLDGWRGIAIAALLAGHFNLMPLIAGREINTGGIGVELFFILSGRLMAEILFVRETPITLFYWRRVSRIFPALWFFVIAIVVASPYFPTLMVTPASAIAALTFTTNYFQNHDAISNVWSLCVEEHAYVLLTLIALLHRRFGARPILILYAVAGACMINGGVQTWIFHREYFSVYWHSDVRIASVAVSAALYLACRNLKVNAALPILATLTGCFISVIGSVPHPIKHSAGTTLIAFGLATLHCAPKPILRLLENPALIYLGLWSYSLYLWQQPFAGHDNIKWIGLVATFACGLASYYFLERPARRWLNNRYIGRSRKVAIEAAT